MYILKRAKMYILGLTFIDSYAVFRPLDAEDLLTAVKLSIRLKADLYQDDLLICSWSQFSMEENIQKLLEKGIHTYEYKGRYSFKWKDDSKNINKYFVHFYSYKWEGKQYLQVFVHDYRTGEHEIEFKNNEELYSFIHKRYSHLDEENIHIAMFAVIGFKGLKLPDLKVAI